MCEVTEKRNNECSDTEIPFDKQEEESCRSLSLLELSFLLQNELNHVLLLVVFYSLLFGGVAGGWREVTTQLLDKSSGVLLLMDAQT